MANFTEEFETLPPAASRRLHPYLEALVEAVHPRRVILFGSQATGRATMDSDFDLLIVRDNSGSSTKERNLEVRRVLSQVDAPPESFTLLTRTPEEINDKLRQGSPFYQDILDQGIVVYAEQADIRD